jgi:F-type H+-transporting ATPase subunit a
MELSIDLAPQIIFDLWGFPITNTLLWLFVLTVFLMLLFIFIQFRLKEVPGKAQGLMELLIEGSYDFVRQVMGDEKKAKKAYALVFTMFILILTANLATFIPGQSAISVIKESGEVPLFRAVMSDYGLVFIMTLISVFTAQIVAISVHGPFGYLGKFINTKGIVLFFKGLAKGKFNFGQLFQGLLDFFLGLMDIIGESAKIISLSFRLFGNMFAGEVLTAVMLFLAPFIVPLPFMFLGLLTAVVQAFVFSVLTLIFITMASEIEKDELAEKATI